MKKKVLIMPTDKSRSKIKLPLNTETSFKICLLASWTIQLQRDIVEQGHDLAEEGYMGMHCSFFISKGPSRRDDRVAFVAYGVSHGYS